MNELIPINETDQSLTTADIDEDMVDWHVANMPPNTIRAYKNVDDKHCTEVTSVR